MLGILYSLFSEYIVSDVYIWHDVYASIECNHAIIMYDEHTSECVMLYIVQCKYHTLLMLD